MVDVVVAEAFGMGGMVEVVVSEAFGMDGMVDVVDVVEVFGTTGISGVFGTAGMVEVVEVFGIEGISGVFGTAGTVDVVVPPTCNIASLAVKVFLPIPGTLAKSSIDPKGPFASRYLTMAAAFFGPIPFNPSSCSTVAVLISIACANTTAEQKTNNKPKIAFINFIYSSSWQQLSAWVFSD